MKISVIIPVYNVEKYLSKCLNSLICQSFQDIEFICINDGSTDNSLNLLEQYALKDSRIKVITQPNKGPACARNKGLSIATGEYISFVDSDDFVENDAYERLYSIAKVKRADLIVYNANAFSNQRIPVENWIHERIHSKRNKFYSHFNTKIIFKEKGTRPFLWLHMVKASVLRDYNIHFNEDLTLGEDQAFQMLYLPYCRRVAFVSHVFYNYRIGNRESLMTRYNEDRYKKINQHLEMMDFVTDYWLAHDFITNVETLFIEWAVEFFYWDFMYFLYDRQIEIAKKLMIIFDKLNYKNHIEGCEQITIRRLRLYELVANTESPINLLQEINNEIAVVNDTNYSMKQNAVYRFVVFILKPLRKMKYNILKIFEKKKKQHFTKLIND